MENSRSFKPKNDPTNSPRDPRGATAEAVETWEGEGGTTEPSQRTTGETL
jgi:hypothetical protein